MSLETKHPKDRVRQLQQKLYLSAKKSKTRRFHALYERIHDWDVLKESWERVRQNHGSAGIDGKTLEEVESQGVEAFLQGIQKYLKEGRYHPVAVRGVQIPKPDGGKRPLGIPTVRDRVVQMAAKLVLEPVFEADFKDSSYGYRPKRGTMEAVEKIRTLANKGHNFVLDADIKNYFGGIDHTKLMQALERRLSDRKTLKLIRKWLKAGVMEDNLFQASLVGTPQGGVISPLLSNIYLHALDECWEKEHSKLGVLVRYCDDFVVLCRTPRALKESQEKVENILQSLSLKLHPEKTRHVNLAWGKEGFDFLGWHIRKRPSARFQGKHFLNRWPSQKSMKRLYVKIRRIVYRTSRVRNVRDFVQKLNPILRGFANYFRTGNSRRKFEQADKYLWMRIVLFENKRRKHKAPYWNPGRFTHAWYKTLGFFDLVRSSLIRYPGFSHANA